MNIDLGNVDVVIPWRYRVDRVAGLAYASDWWRAQFGIDPLGIDPLAIDPLGEPWRKGVAIRGALNRLRHPADVTIVADADVVMTGPEGAHDIATAVREVRSGRAAWAVPHLRVHRHPPAGTAAILAGVEPHLLDDPNVEIHQGHPGGGLVVLSRLIVDTCTLPDPRFAGWGQEDDSWAFALRTLFGVPWRGTQPLHHLWHKPQERMSRSVGSITGAGLYRRYVHARADPEAMRALVDEGWAWWDHVGEPIWEA